MQLCSDEKHYTTCRFVYGEIFNAIPLTYVINKVVGMIQQVLSDPLVLLATTVQLLFSQSCYAACSTTPTGGKATVSNLCLVIPALGTLGRIVGEIKSMSDSKGSFLKVQDSYCEELTDCVSDIDKCIEESQ